MSETQNDALLEEIRKVTKLLALIATKNQQTNREKIETLDSIGFQPKEIADMIGTTANTVSVILSKMRKRAKSKKTKAPGHV